jgi:trk system potassium uptake protein TrkH
MADAPETPRLSGLQPTYAGRPSRRLIRASVERLGPPAAAHVLAMLSNVPTVLKIGWDEPLLDPTMLLVAQVVVLVLYLGSLAGVAVRYRSQPSVRREYLLIVRPELVVALGGLAMAWWAPAPKIAAAGLLVIHLSRLYLSLAQTRIPSGLVFLGSFVALAAVGTLALLLPAATPPDKPITLVDSIFTITSAVSQAGLVVLDTGQDFTRLGQIIILAWIQLGALGVIVFGALLATVIGQSFGLRATQTLAVGAEQGWEGQLSMQKLVTFVIIFTHAVELVGAVALYLAWPETWLGAPTDFAGPVDRFYHCVFFSVSAFCNAGFVTTNASLAGLSAHWTTHIVIAGLIVLGSIGFPVLDNIRRVVWARLRGVRVEGGALVRLNLNSRIILSTTAAMYAIGFGMVLYSTLRHTAEPFGQAVLDAHFMSINRTSGFSSLWPDDEPSLVHLGYVFLRAVGGPPAAVAGGVKLMVVAVLWLTVWSTLVGRDTTTAFGREIPEMVVRKAATLAILWLVTLFVISGLLTATEVGSGHHYLDLLFEASSAVATCGLSSGVTADLSDPGKVILSAGMLLGRIGPFAVLAGLLSAMARRRVRVEYPSEDVVIY